MTPGEFRLRIRYEKSGRLRWLSHLEVLRAMERIVRRSGLPVAVTKGFSPHMKMAFGPALPVGTAGLSEYADIWLTRYTVAGEALERLRAVAPQDLTPVEASYVGDREPSLTAALTIALYELRFEGRETDPTAVHAALERVVGRGELEVENKGKTKVFDLARSVPKDARVQAVDGEIGVEIPIRMGAHGSLRPEALLRAALSEAGTEVSAVRTTRLDLLVEDEKGVWSRPL